jgi:tRNA pseudouridine38-40 synthase
MPRYKLTIEYDGAAYCGWQRQTEGPSVQETLETAITRFSGDNITLQGAGRTDRGVHARGQVAHADLSKKWDGGRIRDAMNAHLTLMEAPISILSASEVLESFDARFSATSRTYCYRILNRRPPAALDRFHAWNVRRPLNIEAMQQGANRLLGHHDFTTFRDADCQAKSPMKTLQRLDVMRTGQETIEIWAQARSFLHRQVRSMVGSLVEVGVGRWTPQDITRMLEARDRSQCGQVAPAAGLYLMSVDYTPSSIASNTEEDSDADG